MEVSRKYSQTRANKRRQRKHDFASSAHLEINIKGIGEPYLSLPVYTYRQLKGLISWNCCNDAV